MSEPYIGRAAEAAARARHNRIHRPMKKTAKKKTAAKKVSTKQAKAFAEALATFKAPDKPNPEPSYFEEDEVQFDADGNAMGPLGDMRAVRLGGETISLQEADAEEGIVPDETVLPTQDAQEPPQPAVPHTVQQPAPNAPQTPLHSEKLGQTPEPPAKPVTHISNEALAQCIEELNDGLIFLSKKGYLKKLQEKDLTILQARINVGKNLIAQLRA